VVIVGLVVYHPIVGVHAMSVIAFGTAMKSVVPVMNTMQHQGNVVCCNNVATMALVL
jgi:hypothetical protein